MGAETEGVSLSKTDGVQEIKRTLGEDDDSYIEGRLLRGDERVVTERKLVRKLDMRLLPCIVLIFIMNYVCW